MTEDLSQKAENGNPNAQGRTAHNRTFYRVAGGTVSTKRIRIMTGDSQYEERNPLDQNGNGVSPLFPR